ncbi:unnamed protein product [Closterium sp. Naga37s-1]|nr:unnamed protein product [Closterium sp. Naga37s-1]
MKSNTTNHRSVFLADESHDESSDEQAQGRHRTGQRSKHARRSLDDVNKGPVVGKTVPAPAAGVKSVAGGGPLDATASGPFPAAAVAAGYSPAAAAAGSSPAAAAAGSSPAVAATGSSPAVAVAGSSLAAAAAGSSPSAIPDGGSPPADVAPDDVVLVGTPAPVEGHAGYTPESAEGMQVAAIAKSQGKLKNVVDRFNDRIGNIYRLCRVYALSRSPCVFMREKRTLKGELTFSEIDDFSKVRFKLRYPHNKAQFKRSGDPSAFSRQARVVQRWINEGPVDRDGDCVGIGSICIVGWKEIHEAELEADELGNLTQDDLTARAAYRMLHNANEVQKEMF